MRMARGVFGWPRVVLAAVVALLGVLMVGCGGGSQDEAAGSSGVALAVDPAASGAQTQALKRRALSYDRNGITAIAVAPDGSAVGVGNADGRVRVLDASGTREVRVLQPQAGAATAGLVFSPDGHYLVTVSRDSVAQVWNVQTGERRFTLRGHEHALRAIAASADGSVIATGGEETRVMVWDGTTGRLKRVLSGPTDFVNALSVSADGRLLASGDAAARILVWDSASGKLLRTLRGHAGEVNAVAFSADGKLLASAGEDAKVILWDLAAGSQVQALEGQRAPVRSLAFSVDGGLLAGGGADGRVVVWDMATHTVSWDLGGSSTAVNSVAFGAGNNSQLFVGNAEDRVLSWNVSRSAVR
jgi:WD40 repeat protein